MRSFTAALVIALVIACGNSDLTPQRPRIFIEPVAGTGQVPAENPAGLDLGQVPLFGVETARFLVRNRGTAALNISGFAPIAVSGGTFQIVTFPDRLGPAEDGELVVEFSPSADGVVDEGTFELLSDDDEAGINDDFVVRGEGLFVGTPTLEVCYNGECRPVDGECTDGTCDLASLDFGNVPLGGLGSQVVTLRNAPPDGTCLAPPDSPDCTRVCQLIFEPDPDGENVGFGLLGGTDFSIAGAVQLPFAIDKPLNGCDVTSEQDFLIRVNAGDTEDVVTDTLVLETNDPAAAVVRIPLTATIREAPTAVAKLRECDILDPGAPCSIEGEIRPLDRFFLDGSDSFDPDGLAITSYSWEVLETPGDIPVSALDALDLDTATPSFAAPVAGTYTLRLTVENEDGVRSGVSETSDIEVAAIPASRLSVELTWRDTDEVDLDLHLTLADDENHRICSIEDDCFWRNCRPSCASEMSCEPANWFGGAPYDGPNPRLDRDDVRGPGPETINIDAPANARYRLYVHYYGLVNEASAPMNAIVRVLLDGVPRGEFRRVLQRNEVWRMADVVWDDGGTIELLPSDGEGQGEVQVLDTCPIGGVEFGTLN